MKTSAKGLALIKQFEGCSLLAYRCPAGALTIGYGHTSSGSPMVVDGMMITQSEADALLKHDLKRFEDEINQLVTAPLAQNQFDALVCWSYNTGALKTSTLLKRINAQELDRVPAELMKWTKAGGKELTGLVRRRRAEAELWRGLDAAAPVNAQARATPDRPKPTKAIFASKEANTALAAGGISAITAASDFADNAQTLSDALKNPTFVVLLAVCAAAAAIWYWRRERLKEEGA
jgi:lysozyme